MDARPPSGSFSRWMTRLTGALASVAFPADCRLCDNLLVRSTRLPICDECLSSFQKLTVEICSLCGQPLAPGEMLDEELDVCRQCQEQKYAFDVARSFGVYRNSLVRAVLLLKYERVEPLGVWFAVRLAELLRSEAGLMRADIIVPVPLHRNRQKERGFNQVELFARPLAKLLGVSYRSVLLVRERPRPEQHLLTNDERWDAVRGAFAIQRGQRVDNLRVLLLDDVMTTGATLDACSSALREAGASSVLGLTIARAVRSVSFDNGER